MGREREAFISECLKAGGRRGAATTREQRAKDCDRAATRAKLSGAAREKFVARCRSAP